MNNLPKPVAQTFPKVAGFCGFWGEVVPRGGLPRPLFLNRLAPKFDRFGPRKPGEYPHFAQPVPRAVGSVCEAKASDE